MKQQDVTQNLPVAFADEVADSSRRRFFQIGGGIVGAGMLLAACKKKNNDSGVNLGSGDMGILNYAYALEQLEAAFYTQVIATQYAGITADEVALLTDIRDHEVAHRQFFKAALGANAIQNLEVDFSTINFSSRASVLGTAKVFEDLGVSAYNGAGRLIVDPEYLLLAGKIVSVEARHAAYIRDLLADNSFADLSAVDASGLDLKNTPSAVLAAAGPYIKTKINASNLPNM